MAENAHRLLLADALVTGYGKKQVLSGVTVDVAAGEIVALIGHNGAGKSTFLRAAFGMLPIWAGRLELMGKQVTRRSPGALLRAGVAYVPQGGRVFAGLTVLENLTVGGVAVQDGAGLKEGIDRVCTLLPVLKTHLRRRAGSLSGGEKQLLSIASALVLSPRLLLLDEPSLGLAPPLVVEALQHIQRMNRDLGVTILVVEQKVREVLKIARRVYVLRNGRITYSGDAVPLQDEAMLRRVFL